jgi:pSer/pThr/pTyr-binding forkhead associated (FHA) protein
VKAVPELILTLRERELSRTAIAAVRTTIGRDPGCDVVIDNDGISRLHAAIEVLGDSFVLRDCESENGITLNGEPCHEGRLVHGDMIGLNKFLLRFSNQTLEVPANLASKPAKAAAALPRDVQRTMHVDPKAAQGLVELAKQQIERRRAELAARGGESSPGLPKPEPARPREPLRPAEPLRWEEPEASGPSLVMVAGAVLVAAMLLAGLLAVVR